MFKSLDSEKIEIFVAHDLNKLPPVTFDHVDITRLLKDIVVLQNEVKPIKNTYVTMVALQTQEDCLKRKGKVVTVNSSFEANLNLEIPKTSYRYINLKRGSDSFYCNSGPIGKSKNCHALYQL